MEREDLFINKNMTLLDWSLISLIIHKVRYVLMPTMHSIDAFGLRRMSSDCPGDRFGKCHQWKKIHLNCLFSRGFEIITKQLGENLLVFTPDTFKYKMMRLYHEKQLELEYAKGKYFEKSSILLLMKQSHSTSTL